MRQFDSSTTCFGCQGFARKLVYLEWGFSYHMSEKGEKTRTQDSEFIASASTAAADTIFPVADLELNQFPVGFRDRTGPPKFSLRHRSLEFLHLRLNIAI